MTMNRRLNQIGVATLCLSLCATAVSAQTSQPTAEQVKALAQRVNEVVTRVDEEAGRQGARGVSPSRAFNVVLLIGDLKNGTGMEENIPAAAKRALSDMKEFLPYKSYRFFDSTWVLHGDESLGQSSNRLRGPDDEIYMLGINSMTGRNKRSSSPKQMDVVVGLSDPTPRGKLLSTEIMSARTSMDIGETIVVGTSRLRGDTALILLLTATTEPPRVREGARK